MRKAATISVSRLSPPQSQKTAVGAKLLQPEPLGNSRRYLVRELHRSRTRLLKLSDYTELLLDLLSLLLELHDLLAGLFQRSQLRIAFDDQSAVL